MSEQLTFRWGDRVFSIAIAESQQKALADVVMERDRQDAERGEQNHSPVEWLSVLTEEVGEAAEAANKWNWNAQGEPLRRNRAAMLRTELTHVAAVAIAAIESLDRNELKQP